MVECLDKDDVERFDEYVVALFYECVLACLDKNDNDDFDGDFLHTHPL